MSYILDALRRADAERERDPGRGIHAQPVPLPAESGRRVSFWILVVGATTALVLVVAIALLLRPAPRVSLDLGMPPPNAPLSRQAPVGPVAPVAPVLPVASEVSPPAPPPLPERPVVQAPVPAPRAAASAAVAAVPHVPHVPALPSAVAAPAPAPAAVAAPAATQPAVTAPALTAPAVASPATAERVVAVSELPPEVQRGLPKLQVSGGVYSDNAAQRMLIVGGQVVTEGHEAAPGVVVEQIRAKSAVLKFRGYRFSVQY